jgi:GT2 family glycosyltransferase
MSSLSVVIPTFDRVDRLREALHALSRQVGRCGDFEVIVVSDGSTDDTDRYLRSSEPPLPVHAISQENQGPAAARNRGVEAATGDLILFIDDDVVAGPHLVESHLQAHERLGPDVVVLGPMLSPPDFKMSPWVEWEQAMLYKQYDAMSTALWMPTARQFYTGNASLLRRHLVDAGGFDPRFRRAEDVELCYRRARRGLTFFYEPGATSYHYAQRSYRSWLTSAYSYGCNDVIFARDRGESWLIPTMRREFERQHRALRALVDLALSRRLVRPVTASVLPHLKWVALTLRPVKLRMALLSFAFGLNYYRGVADELGSWRAFLDVRPETDVPATETTTDEVARPVGQPRASIVIPAHNEASVIERCIDAFSQGAEQGEFEVVVVANGCSDDTADRARLAMPDARVVELDAASKVAALNAGDHAARTFPRIYLDADVVVDAQALRAVIAALEHDGAMCAAPTMAVELRDRPWYVRAFYRTFLDLPYVKGNLIGNGFYALSATGRARFDDFPDITADDLFVRNLFEQRERVVVPDRYFRMFPPRRFSGLLAMRQRAYRGNDEYEAAGYRSRAEPTRSARSFLSVAVRRPVGFAIYVAVNLTAKATWRRNSGTWERDDSGRGS